MTTTVANELIEVIGTYMQHSIAKVVAPSLVFEFAEEANSAFNASVTSQDQRAFLISVCTGCPAMLNDSMAQIDDSEIAKAEAALSAVLFGGVDHHLEVRRLVLVMAINFVYLHELSHVVRGHFRYGREHGLLSAVGGAWRLDEVERRESGFAAADDPEASSTPSDPDALKLIELDADRFAFDLAIALAYEMLAAGENFRVLLPAINDPEDIPAETEVALAEVVLSACASIFFLMDASRVGTDAYPSPMARLLNVTYRLCIKRVFPEAPTGTHEVVTTKQDVERFRDEFVPALMRAAKFGMACARGAVSAEIGESRERLDLDENDLLSDLLAILRGRGHDAASSAGRECEVLLKKSVAFEESLVRHPVGS